MTEYKCIRVKRDTHKKLLTYKWLLELGSADELINIALMNLYDNVIVSRTRNTQCRKTANQESV